MIGWFKRCTGGAALLAAALLGACGGGSSQYDAFVPQRIIVLGDELSTLTADGHRYGVNFASATVAFDCLQNIIWVQSLALRYSMYFPQCLPPAATTPSPNTNAHMLAVAGATSADTIVQADAYQASTGFTSSDLVTVLAGVNDVLAAYAQYPARDEAALTADMQAAGLALAARVNALTDTGARVLVATAPDVGLSPFAQAEKAAHTDTDRAALMSRLLTAFNTALRLALLNDGSKIGLLLGDDLSRSMTRVPSAYGIVNTTAAVCLATAPLPTCTSLTLVPDATAGQYLWADATRFSTTWQAQLGFQAGSRMDSNPF